MRKLATGGGPQRAPTDDVADDSGCRDAVFKLRGSDVQHRVDGTAITGEVDKASIRDRGERAGDNNEAKITRKTNVSLSASQNIIQI